MSRELHWDDDRLARRRAIEALRSGVPNADAVTALGSGQSDIEDRFTGLLEDASEPRAGRRGRASMLLGAGFGAGKSHLLTHLGHLAHLRRLRGEHRGDQQGDPLHDPAKVLRAAVESAVAPDGARDVVSEAAAALDTDSVEYAELLRWLRGPAGTWTNGSTRPFCCISGSAATRPAPTRSSWTTWSDSGPATHC
ncbi:MAG: hypothetical protein WKF76_08955 [Nocardioidaceae bacterium]